MVAVKADLNQIPAPVKSGEHRVTGELPTGSADMQAGIAMKGSVKVPCVVPWHGFTAVLANYEFLTPTFQISAVIWLSATDTEGRVPNLYFAGRGSAL